MNNRGVVNNVSGGGRSGKEGAVMLQVITLVLIPALVGGAIVAVGSLLLPPTYHWDGKKPVER